MLLPALALASTGFVPPLSQAVVYEANLRAEGAQGGFAALTRRLDTIKRLGVNVLWLMPVQPVGRERSAGGLGSPYATRDYHGVNPEFGSPNDLKRLIAQAHRRKIAVILDWVANHTAWDHPWIKAHPDWYTHDASGRITIPAGTNWNDVADLNFANPSLRKAMIAEMQTWVEKYGIDGFRCDTADWVPADFWTEAIRRIRAASPRPILMLAEGFRKENSNSGFDLEYGWPFYDRLVAIYKGESASNLSRAAAQEATNGIPHLRFVTNHDKAAWEGTPTDFFRTPQGVRTAVGVTALYEGGVPLIYSGQEVAWSKRIPIFERSSIDWNISPDSGRWLTDLMRLRREHPSLRDGATRDLSTQDVILFSRHSKEEEVLVVANVRDRKATVAIPRGLQGLWRDGFTRKPESLVSDLLLPAFDFRVWVRSAQR